MRKYFWIIILGLFLTRAYSAPSNSVSIPNSFTAGTTAVAADVNEDFNEVQSKFNAHTHTDITSLGTVTTGTWNGSVIGTAYGGTGNANGVGLPSGAVFFMASGSCPTGTTDISTTYANKFVRIAASQLATGGADTDSITLTTNELPAHTHTYGVGGDYAASTAKASQGDNGVGTTNVATSSSGSGAAFSVDTVPAYITMKACQVN